MALNRAVEINHGRDAGYSTSRPNAQRSRKGFVHRLFGQIKITEQADQSCQDSSRIGAIKRVEQFAYLLGEPSDMTTTLANQLPRINLANDGSMHLVVESFRVHKMDMAIDNRDRIWIHERWVFYVAG